MISETRQRFATIGIVAVALVTFVLGAIYSDGGGQTNSPYVVGATAATNPVVVGGATGVAGGANGAGQNDNLPAASTTPLDGFLPKSGTASACSEPIGVDLATGFGARLTINDQEIPPEQMNVVLDDDGEISRVQTAGRSIGHYTFAADDNCPNGSLIRASDNLLEVCVYRLSDTAQKCIFRTSNMFDAA